VSTENVGKKNIKAEKLKEVLSNTGLLVHKEGSGHLDFNFTYLGYPFAVRAQSRDDVTTIDIRTILGNMPYSAESYNSRVAAAKILSAINAKLGLNMVLTKNQKLILSNEVTNDKPITPHNLLTLVTTMLLQAKPYLDLLSEYVKPSGEIIDHPERVI
jgi:hypothetical protein